MYVPLEKPLDCGDYNRMFLFLKELNFFLMLWIFFLMPPTSLITLILQFVSAIALLLI